MARRFDDFRRAGPALLVALLLACFGRLAADPSALIVDADRPSLDHNRPPNEPTTVGNDATRLFVPHHAAIAVQLARLGRIPTWDERGFGGRPLVGNPQAGLYYPPHWLAWRFWSPSILGWIAVAHLLWAGLGTYFLSRSIGLGRWASTVAAGCFQASPYVLGQTFEGHYPHVNSASWMPWAFLATLGLRRGNRRSALLLVPILTLAGLAGHPQEAYYLAIALACWGIAEILVDFRAGQGGEAIRLGIWGIAVAALTLGISAIEWLPDAHAAQWTLRQSTLAVDQASRYHLYPLNLLQLLGPFALGRPFDYFGHDNYWESLVAFGLIPLSLAIAGLAWSPHRRAARGWAALILLSVLFAAGREGGLFTLLYQFFPGMDRFRVPSRSLFLASLGMAILCGMGVDALRQLVSHPDPWPIWIRRAWRSSLALAGLILIGGWLAEHPFPIASSSAPAQVGNLDPLRRNPKPARIPEPVRFLKGLGRLRDEPAFWMALGGLAITSLWARLGPDHRPRVAMSLGLLGLVELGTYGHSLIVTAPIDRFLGPDPIGDSIAADTPTDQGPVMIRALDSLYDDFRAIHRGFRKTNINDSFQIQHAADLYETLYHTFRPDRLDLGRPMDSAVSEFRRQVRQGVLDRLGVRYLIADQSSLVPELPRIASGRWNGSNFVVNRNPSALPRAYVVPRAMIARDDPRMVQRFPSIDPRQSVLMAADPLPASRHRQPFTPAERIRADPDHRILEVTTRYPGLLVLEDTWMPGWQARVNNRPTTILRGNRSQMGLPLATSGMHQIKIVYHPPGLFAGSAITCLSIMVWICLSRVKTGSKNRGRRRMVDESD